MSCLLTFNFLTHTVDTHWQCRGLQITSTGRGGRLNHHTAALHGNAFNTGFSTSSFCWLSQLYSSVLPFAYLTLALVFIKTQNPESCIYNGTFCIWLINLKVSPHGKHFVRPSHTTNILILSNLSIHTDYKMFINVLFSSPVVLLNKLFTKISDWQVYVVSILFIYNE